MSVRIPPNRLFSRHTLTYASLRFLTLPHASLRFPTLSYPFTHFHAFICFLCALIAVKAKVSPQGQDRWSLVYRLLPAEAGKKQSFPFYAYSIRVYIPYL